MNSNNFSTTEINKKLSNGYVSFSKEVKKAAKYVMDNPAAVSYTHLTLPTKA